MSSTYTDVSRQLRLLLSSPDSHSLDELIELVNAFVLGTSAAPDSEVLIARLEEDLQAVYNDAIDHAVISHLEIFLAVLYHLLPVLTPNSLISTWFDLTLRPALREPKLSVVAVDYAKQLIISACNVTSSSGDANFDACRDKKVCGFRRQLMDLYLLDAFNESSGDDILEWAELDEHQRHKKAYWKANLEDVLVRTGIERPHVCTSFSC